MSVSMRSRRSTAAVLFFCFASSAVALADDVVPTENVVNSVRLRSGPSADTDIIGNLEPGERATLLSDDNPGWYKVNLEGTIGFVTARPQWTRVEPAGAPAAGAAPAADVTAGTVKVTEARSIELLSDTPPAEGGYRVHLIDVGTGLSILIQGHAFNMVFDGGSRDDKPSTDQHRNRLLSYLFATVGPSGPASCKPAGDNWPAWGGVERTIDHLVLSHPHEDHNSLLADVLRCYRVENVWDSGVINDSDVHEGFIEAVSKESGTHYHTAADVPANRKVKVNGKTYTFPASITWTSFAEGDTETLDAGAEFKILYADGVKHGTHYNDYSTVMRVDLGRRSLLLTGDAESGARLAPTAPAGNTERALIDRHKQEIDVDILQVGHHGSMTSNREEFIKAVSPHWALIGSGPFAYSGKVLPDDVIVDELNDQAKVVLNTNLHDDGCPAQDRVGADNDAPGGCENFILDIAP